MNKLVLVRHGESEWNKLNLFTGWTDVDLSEKGHEESRMHLMYGVWFAYKKCLTKVVYSNKLTSRGLSE